MSIDLSDETLGAILDRALEATVSADREGAEVVVGGGRRSRLIFIGQRTSDATLESLWLRVRVFVWVDGEVRAGVARTTDLSDDGILEVVAEADAVARVSPPIEVWRGVVDPVDIEVGDVVERDAVDRATVGAGAARRAEAAAQAILAAMHVGLEASGTVTVTHGEHEDTPGGGVIAFGNSLGVRRFFKRTSVSYAISLQGDDRFARGQRTRDRWGDMDEASLVAYVRDKAATPREPDPPAPGTYVIGFEPAAVAAMVDMILPSFSATEIAGSRSYLRTRRRQQIASPRVSLRADPGAPELRLRPFDGEGQPCGALDLIVAGVHEDIAIDRRSGWRRREPPNGYGVLQPSPLAEVPWGVRLDAEGEGDAQAMMGRIGVPTLWVSELATLVAADTFVSRVVVRTTGGVLEVADGAIRRAFPDMTLALPIWELLTQIIDASEVERVGDLLVPAIVFYDVEVV